MSEIERQVRSFWARLLDWLRGPRGAEATRRAKVALNDVRTSECTRSRS